MTNFTRRHFIKGAVTGSALAMAGFSAQAKKNGKHKHVVIVGGGFGGATAAKYLKKFDPNVQVTLVEAEQKYITCPGSNWVLGGLRDMNSITHGYGNLGSKYGIKIVHAWVTDIDPAKQTVTTKDGSGIHYDRLIVSPGVRFLFDGLIEGYSKAVAEETAPHAWKAGPQTVLLRKQLEAMPDGGVFVVAPPPNPFRCPPGPGERISMVAHYFKQHKPKSKIIAVDGKGAFSKQGLFKEGWEKMYGDMIEYHHNTKIEELHGKTLVSEVGEEFKADVLNMIPAQKAGWIAEHAGLTDKTGWCPVDHLTWESKMHKNIHVIGDAAIQSPLPKSGYAANSEAKVCAASIVALLNGVEPYAPSWVNTCYSLVGPEYGISVAMVYDLKGGKVSKVEGSGGLTPKDANRAVEAVFAKSWYDNVVDDVFG